MSATLKAKATLDDKPFQAGIRRMKDAAKSVGRGIGVAAGVAGGALLAVGGAAIVAGVKMGKATSAAIDHAAALRKVSKASGVSIKDLAALEDSYAENGLELKDLADSFKKMQMTLGAPGASGQLRDTLQDMGIDFRDLKEASPAHQLQMIAKGLDNIVDPAEKVAAATKFFKKGGAEMIPILQDVAGLDLSAKDKQGDAFERLADKAKLLKQTMAQVTDNMEGFGIGMAESLIPKLQEMSEWMKANTENAQELGESMGDLFKAIQERKLGATITSFKKLWELFKAAKDKALKERGTELPPMTATGRDPFEGFNTAHSRKNDFFDEVAGRKAGMIKRGTGLKAGGLMSSSLSSAGLSLSNSGAYNKTRRGDSRLRRMADAANGDGIGSGSTEMAGHVIRRGDAKRAQARETMKKLEEYGLSTKDGINAINSRLGGWDQ